MKKLLLTFLCLYSFFVVSQNKEIEKLVKISDSIETAETYKVALDFWKENQSKAPKLSKHYITYFRYWNDTEKQSFNQIIDIQKTLLKSPNRDKFETNLLLKVYSNHYHHIAENDTWEKALEKALEGYNLKDFDQVLDETKTDYLYDIGYIYGQMGNSFEAKNFYEKTLALYIQQNGEIDNEVALNYNNLAAVYRGVGNSKKSLQYSEKAANIWQKVYQEKEDKNNYLITVYHNLVDGYIEYGDFEKAQQSLKILNQVFETKYKYATSKKEANFWSAKKSHVLTNIRVLVWNNKATEAENLINTLVNDPNFSYKEPDDVMYLLQCYNEIINFYEDKKRYKEMEVMCFKALKIAKKYQKNHHLMAINFTLAKSYFEAENHQLALKYSLEAIKNNDITNFNTSKYSLEILNAAIYQKLNKNKKSVDIAKENVEQLLFDVSNKKKRIETITFKDVKEFVSTTFISVFYQTGKVYLNHYQLTKDKKDLVIAENLYKIAAQLFQEYYLKGEFNEYLNYYHAKITEGLLDCLRHSNANLEKKTEIINLIERNASQHLIKEFDRKLKRTNSKNTALIDDLKNLQLEFTFYSNQKKELKDTKKIAELKKRIKNITEQITSTEKNFSNFNFSNFNVKEVISNLTNDQQIIKYYVCDKSIFIVSLDKNDIQIKKINQKEKWENRVTTYINQIKKISPEVSSKKENLFENLMPLDLKKSITIIPDGFLNYLPFETLFNAKTKKYLIENHLISNDYSLPMWLLHQKNKGKNYYNIAAFSPFYTSSSKTTNRSDFRELKYAGIEAESIVNLFGGTLYEKETATKENFIKEKDNFDIFHLSMHSQLFEEDFNKSCLIFSNEEKLYFSELYGMHIPASLVVLSACDTGNGILKSGEGIMSINRALIYAGVKSAVVSLWQVPDKETSEIMISFYENLKKGQAKDEALANAKNTFIKNNPMRNHPFYWAGFIVTGDISPITTTNYWGWITAFLVATTLFFLFYYRKNHCIVGLRNCFL